MSENTLIKNIDASNVGENGFFCYMSKPKSPGYRQKREWLEARFAEGMCIKILHEVGGRDVGFIEYIPGEYAWRAVHAPEYLVIHCLWVVGKGKGKGYGSRLIQECLQDARAQGKAGVAILTSDRVWLVDKKIFLKNGFEQIDQAPPAFQLLAVRTRSGVGPEPSLPQDWEARARAFGPGLTVIRTPQCPYIENGTNDLLEFARERGISARSVELTSARDVQQRSPSAYGVFGSVLDSRILAYHYLLRKDFDKLMLEREKGN
jgi:GNAT superfamily N-acetyltransferase